MTNEEILKNVYKYQSKAELTAGEIETITEMFDKPEKFVVLRKLLQVLTDEERDIQIPSEAAMISTSPEDLKEYGLKVAINMRADEKIRQALLSMYTKVKTWHVSQVEESLNIEAKEEDKKAEKAEEKQLAKRRAGVNV